MTTEERVRRLERELRWTGVGYWAPTVAFLVLLNAFQIGCASRAQDSEPVTLSSAMRIEPQESRNDEDRGRQIRHLVKQLESGDAQKRSTAANQLGHLGAVEAVPSLIARLDDADEEVVYFALCALVELHATQILERAREFLRHRSPRLRAGAITALGQFGDRESVPEIAEQLSDRSAMVREAAFLGLLMIGDDRAAPALVGMLDSSHRDSRYWAIVVLGRLGEKQHAKTIARFLQDPQEEVRGAALCAVGALDPGGYRPVLIEALESKSQQIRHAAMRALAARGDPAVLDEVIASRDRLALARYVEPETMKRLDTARIGVHQVRWLTVRDMLKLIAEKSGVEILVSSDLPREYGNARLSPAAQMLAMQPEASALLSSVAGPGAFFFLTGVSGAPSASAVDMIVETRKVHVTTRDKASAYWDAKAKEIRSKSRPRDK